MVINMNGTQRLIESIRNATQEIDYSNLPEDQINNLRTFFDKHMKEYGDKTNWKMPIKTRVFDPATISSGIENLLEICGIVQALLFFVGGYNIWEEERGQIAISSDGYYQLIGA